MRAVVYPGSDNLLPLRGGSRKGVVHPNDRLLPLLTT